MDALVLALAPAFAVGFAVQRLLELLDPLFDAFPSAKESKKLMLGLISLMVGALLAFGLGLRVLEPLGVQAGPVWDGMVAALVISAGTEGFNSIVKFLGYAKENKKAQAAISVDEVPEASFSHLARLV